MKRRMATGLCGILLLALLQAKAQNNYPPTHKANIKEEIFGLTIEDPYRWLEFEQSTETREWVKKQNDYSLQHLQSISCRTTIADKLKVLWNFKEFSSPVKVKDVYYFLRREGHEQQAALLSQADLKVPPAVLIDPKMFDAAGNVAIDAFVFSKAGKYLAFTTTDRGSEWRTARIMDMTTKKILNDKLDWLKLGKISWYGDEGFYYSRYPQPAGAFSRTTETVYHAVYFHKIGEAQSADKLIYEERTSPYLVHTATVTEDDDYLILSTTNGGTNNRLMFRPADPGKKKPFKTIIEGYKYESFVFDNDKTFFYVKTNTSAPRYRICAVNIDNPYVNNWETLVPEQAQAVEQIVPCGGNWFATYVNNVSNTLSEFTMGGYKLRDIEVPPYSTVNITPGRLSDREMLYTVTGFSSPTSIHATKVAGEKTETIKQVVRTSNDSFETRQMFVINADSSRVPVFISYKSGTNLKGNNPMLLKVEGGFNEVFHPEYDPAAILFMQAGGIYAQVSTRGGGEYGEKWRKAGMLYDKQNSVLDLVAAAKMLIREGYTSSERLAVTGKGNGGLLVGAALTQVPKLFKAAIPEMALLDMMRYQKFTSANAWWAEYGNVEEGEQFDNLYGYSPLLNLQPATVYPATLIITADNDDKVVPAHSYKFAARMQEVQAGPSPVLLWVSSNTGHDFGTPLSKLREMEAVKLCFLAQQLGMRPE